MDDNDDPTFGAFDDKGKMFPELARILCVWKQHKFSAATEDELSYWARQTAAMTARFPDPRSGFLGLRNLGLITEHENDQITLITGFHETCAESDLGLEQLTKAIGIFLFERMLTLDEFRLPLERCFSFVFVRDNVGTVEWQEVPVHEQRNPAWIWLQHLRLAQHIDETFVVEEALFPFVTDATVRQRPLSQAELDQRLAAQRERSRLAEELIVALERARLRAAGLNELANGVIRISDDDVTAGYDVLSFELTGAPRYIEVKSSAGPRSWFIWTRNEYEVARELENSYWIAWVSWASRLPDGRSDVEWFRNPVAILEAEDPPWHSIECDLRIAKLRDDSEVASSPD
ncbi:MAG: DUF3883 domain-containing protein [Pirellulales bacterium]